MPIMAQVNPGMTREYSSAFPISRDLNFLVFEMPIGEGVRRRCIFEVVVQRPSKRIHEWNRQRSCFKQEDFTNPEKFVFPITSLTIVHESLISRGDYSNF
jgi:hypothetical protein